MIADLLKELGIHGDKGMRIILHHQTEIALEQFRAVDAEARVATLTTERDGLREKYALIAENWKSPLKPGSVDRLNGHKEAARWIAKAIREEN